MSSQDKIDKDGIRDDHVPYDPAASRLHIYQDDRQQLANFQTPILLHVNNPHERLFVAALDGTGNDKIHDPDHETNVGLISDQIETLNDAGNTRIAAGYIPGPGTQADAITRTLDGARGYTADARVEDMYKQFIDRAWQWKQQDPEAQIRVSITGFSRGGDEAALLTRLIEERGIQDRAGANYTYDSHHQITHVEYTKPPLVPPHQVAQAVALFDPVGTGHVMHEDRRLPPSVISGIQFTAMDEHRGLFKSDRIIDPGITPDGRFAGVYVPGAHSDDGGSYHRDGLSIRTGNLAIDYLNGLSDQPYLARQVEPDDPRLNVIHHSQDGMLLYRVAPKIDRLQPGGYNELEVPRSQIGHVADPYNAEPRNDALSRQFQWQQTYPELPPAAQLSPTAAPTQPIDPSATPVSTDPIRLQQRALHGENSQVDRAHEAQRQQETQGHVAAHEAPLPPAPAAISPGARIPEREAPPSRQEPRPAVREQAAQAPTPAHHEPTTAPAAPDHAALAAQQAHQQAMHAQRQAQQERPHDERAAPAGHSHVSPEPHAVAAAAVAAPAVAASLRETSPAAHEPPAPAAPAEPARRDSAQASAPHTHAPEHRPPATGQAALAARDLTHAPSTAAHVPATHAASQAVAHAPTLSPPLDPPALKDFRHPDHPLNTRYQMFRDALGEQGFHEARPTLNQAPAVRGYSAEQKDRLAAGFTAQMGSDRQFNTEIQHFRKDGDALLAIEHPERLGDTPLVLALPEKEALARSPEQHAAAWRARELPAPEAVNTQRPDPRSLSPEHPGHPDHPRNTMFEHTREALTTEYARWGMQKGAEQLDRETVQVMTAARKGQMDDVGAVRLMPNRDEGKIGAFPKMHVFETAQAAAQGAPSTVIVQGQTLQQAPPVQQAAPQFHVEDQQATQQMQQNQQLQAQVNAQGPQGPGLGGGPGR